MEGNSLSYPEIGRISRPGHLFFHFSLLSFIAFVLIGYFVMSAVRPRIFDFIVSQEEADISAAVDNLAELVLQKDDFKEPLTPAKESRLSLFIDSIHLQGLLATAVIDSEANVLESRGGAEVLDQEAAYGFARESVRPFARLRTASPQEKLKFGEEELLEIFVPIVFDSSTDAVGVARLLFETQAIYEVASPIEREIISRIVLGLLFLYFILAIIVWGASRTIHRQAGALHEYASTLEVKVKERTRDLEDTTKREVAALKEISRLKDDFVFIAAHELRAPVTVLEWGLDKLHHEKDFFDTLPPDLKNQFGVMEKSSRRLSALIVDLLSVARLDSGTLKIEKHPLSLKETLLPLLEEDAGVAREKEISIIYSKEEISRIPMVLGDTMRLQEVFGNLLSNAIKFNRQGGEVRVWAEYKGTFVEVTIQDTGVGIKKEDMDKLFTKFFRGRENIEGTGLGLWISKEIMRRLDGDLLASSEEGKGTTFRVLIPRG